MNKALVISAVWIGMKAEPDPASEDWKKVSAFTKWILEQDFYSIRGTMTTGGGMFYAAFPAEHLLTIRAKLVELDIDFTES